MYKLQTRHSSQGDWPKERLQAVTGRKSQRIKNLRLKQKTMLEKSRRENVRVTILLTDIALASYITLVVRLM
jgi:hypothetical protein